MIRCCSRFRIETVSNESSVLLLVVVVMERITLLCLLSSWFGASSAQETRNVNVPEGGDALLSCGLDSLQRIDEFDWRKDNGDKEKMEVFEYVRGSYPGKGQDEQFKSRVEFFQHELNSGNASIKIKDARLEDNGTYICGLGLLKEHRQEFHIRLNVGAARMPYIQTIRDKIIWRLLVCKVNGNPVPEVEWRNSEGEVLAKHNPKTSNGFSQVELQLKVNRSDSYTCVATQREIGHQISHSTEVSIPDVTVSEGDDALLACTINVLHFDLKNITFSWRRDDTEIFLYDKGRVKEDKQFIGRLRHYQQELKSGNASLTILSTQPSDSGRYTCHFSDIQKSSAFLFVVGKRNKDEYSIGIVIALSIGVTTVVLFLVVGIIVKLLFSKGYRLSRTSGKGKTQPKLLHHPSSG